MPRPIYEKSRVSDQYIKKKDHKLRLSGKIEGCRSTYWKALKPKGEEIEVSYLWELFGRENDEIEGKWSSQNFK